MCSFVNWTDVAKMGSHEDCRHSGNVADSISGELSGQWEQVVFSYQERFGVLVTVAAAGSVPAFGPIVVFSGFRSGTMRSHSKCSPDGTRFSPRLPLRSTSLMILDGYLPGFISPAVVMLC